MTCHWQVNVTELLAIQLPFWRVKRVIIGRTGPDQMYVLIGLWIGLQMYGNRKIAPTDVHYNIGTDKSTSRELRYTVNKAADRRWTGLHDVVLVFLYLALSPPFFSPFILSLLLVYYYIIMCFKIFTHFLSTFRSFLLTFISLFLFIFLYWFQSFIFTIPSYSVNVLRVLLLFSWFSFIFFHKMV